MAVTDKLNHFSGFSKLDRKERFARLVQMGALTAEDVKVLSSTQLPSTDLAEKFIENVIGYFPMPLGVAANFRIDNEDYAIPMAVEETSIIAAASKTAKWVRECGEINTSVEGSTLIGQVQVAKVKDFEQFKARVLANEKQLVADLNKNVGQSMVNRGGGVRGLTVRKVDRADDAQMAVVHVLVDTRDAMGANFITQVCEALKEPLQTLTAETVSMCILSNLCDTKLTHAEVIIRDIDPAVGAAIAEGSLFAELDPYRAATNNKGILNGMDPILLATGNDWRAVECGVHAYATRDGRYRSIAQWQLNGKDLVGKLSAPIVVGTVGGMTRLHPIAKLSLNMLGIKSANHLGRIVAAVGLVQNLGAIRALTSVGLIEGHMKLHISNLSLGAGAKPMEIPLLEKRLREILALTKKVTLSNAIEVLKEIREKGLHSLTRSHNS